MKILATKKVSAAERTIEWFYSGRKGIGDISSLTIETPCNGVENDAPALQSAMGFGDCVYLPAATFTIKSGLNGTGSVCYSDPNFDGHSFNLSS